MSLSFSLGVTTGVFCTLADRSPPNLASRSMFIWFGLGFCIGGLHWVPLPTQPFQSANRTGQAPASPGSRSHCDPPISRQLAPSEPQLQLKIRAMISLKKYKQYKWYWCASALQISLILCLSWFPWVQQISKYIVFIVTPKQKCLLKSVGHFSHYWSRLNNHKFTFVCIRGSRKMKPN